MRPRPRGLRVLLGVLLGGLAFVLLFPLCYHPTHEHPRHDFALRRLVDGALAYWHDEHVSADGELLPRQLPASAGPTPARPLCADGPRYRPDPADWARPTWEALRFAFDDPHRHRVEFVSDAEGFTARVFGDLDCDGVVATYTRVGVVQGEELAIFPADPVHPGE